MVVVVFPNWGHLIITTWASQSEWHTKFGIVLLVQWKTD